MATPRRLLVTHHAPDLDAIGAVWLFKRFYAQHYAHAKVAFVNAGEEISYEEAQELGFQMHEVTHVDTGMGEFDHHQPDRGLQHLSATLLVYKHILKIHPDLAKDETLKTIVDFITDGDHFAEVNWPEPEHYRYCFMINELIHGMEFVDPHTDESQLYFGLECLDAAYGALKEHLRAAEIIAREGKSFDIKAGKVLALATKNGDTVKLGQKQGYTVVVMKDPDVGNIRVKARPDAQIDLKPLADEIAKIDHKGSWFYHPSGKMLINGSRKNRGQRPSDLSLDQVVALMKSIYG